MVRLKRVPLVLLLIGAVSAQLFEPTSHNSPKCQPVTIPMCLDIPYNETMMPNLLGHPTQEEASNAINQFNPLVKVHCSDDIKLFLCTLHAPLCTSVLDKTLPPCRHLCLSAKRGCEALMVKFGFRWPEQMDCSLFPTTFCVGENKTSRGDSWENEELECPSSMRAPFSSNYELRLSKGRLRDCSLPCDTDDVTRVLFTATERSGLRVWTALWAAACLVSSLFTILTFFIDLGRFNYPVRPILYMAMSYAVIALTYLVGVSNDNKYSCSTPTAVSLVSQRLTNMNCTLMALVFHFCMNASAAWWLVLCVSWFLAARLQWSNEAISSFWPHFHVLAWGVPAVLSLLLLITETIDGDVITGICSVGNLDGSALFYLVVLPQATAILVGLVFLVSGICSMVHIRSYYKLRQAVDQDVRKLEKLMMRVSLFALLYTLPTSVGTAINAYQSMHVSHWLQRAYTDRCLSSHREAYGFLISKDGCPPIERLDDTPDMILFACKYVTQLIVGITCAVWVFSLKTIGSYQKAYGRLLGRQPVAGLDN